MLLASVLLMIFALLILSKMSTLNAKNEDEQSPAPPPTPELAASPNPPVPSPPQQPAVGEQEQIVVYNPTALRRPTLAKFVLGSFDDNSSDDEVIAAAFRVGSRRSSLASAGGAGAEPPTMAALQEFTAGIRYNAMLLGGHRHMGASLPKEVRLVVVTVLSPQDRQQQVLPQSPSLQLTVLCRSISGYILWDGSLSEFFCAYVCTYPCTYVCTYFCTSTCCCAPSRSGSAALSTLLL